MHLCVSVLRFCWVDGVVSVQEEQQKTRKGTVRGGERRAGGGGGNKISTLCFRKTAYVLRHKFLSYRTL